MKARGVPLSCVILLLLGSVRPAQAQLPMDIIWQHAPWTFESGANTIVGAIGGGGGSSNVRWCHFGDPSSTYNCITGPWIEQEFLFDPVYGRPSLFPFDCRFDEYTHAYTYSGLRIWSDMIGNINYVFVGGSNLPCSDSLDLNSGQFFRGITEEGGNLFLFGLDNNCVTGARIWSVTHQWCACLEHDIGGLALYGDTLLACDLPLVTRLDKYTGTVLDSLTVFTDTVAWGRVRTREDTLFWLVMDLNNELWSGAFVFGSGELWRTQLPTTVPTSGWLLDHHGRSWFAAGSTFIRQERSDGTLQAYPVSEPILRVFERDGDLYWVGDLGAGSGYTVQCARPWP